MDIQHFLAEATAARAKAYAPYSQFKVGSVVVAEDGSLLHGCNVENVAYGPSNCAERTALFRAISDGHLAGSFRAIAVVGDTPGPISPCGVCRQVMVELCSPDMPVIMGNLRGDYKILTVSELMPEAFHDLQTTHSNSGIEKARFNEKNKKVNHSTEQ